MLYIFDAILDTVCEFSTAFLIVGFVVGVTAIAVALVVA